VMSTKTDTATYASLDAGLDGNAFSDSNSQQVVSRSPAVCTDHGVPVE
jgi:hypothetical protein